MEAVAFFGITFGCLLAIGLTVTLFTIKAENAKSEKLKAEFLKQYE